MRTVLAVVWLTALLAGGAARPEEAEAARLNAEVVRLFRAGKYDEALPPARRVVELGEKAHGADHPALASPLFNLGAPHARNRQFGEAEKFFRRRWRFSPTLPEGRPVKVTGTVTVNFAPW